MTDWKLVPVEPTQDMLQAGERAWMNRDLSRADSDPITDCYRAMLAAAPSPAEALPSQTSGAEEDWRDDPASDERWNAGCDFAMTQLCAFLGIDPATVDWDAATETLDGDVQSVIGKILRAKLGEDWGPREPLANPASEPAGGGVRGIYIASKTTHGARWRALRTSGVPIISTWIDEAEAGATSNWPDLWHRCVREAAQAAATIIYREPGEVLKGAFVEMGAALAAGRTVFAVGCDEFSVRHHMRVVPCESLEEALELAAALSSPASSSPAEAVSFGPSEAGIRAKADRQDRLDRAFRESMDIAPAEAEALPAGVEAVREAGVAFADQVEVLLSADTDMPTYQQDYDDTEAALEAFRAALEERTTSAGLSHDGSTPPLPHRG